MTAPRSTRSLLAAGGSLALVAAALFAAPAAQAHARHGDPPTPVAQGLDNPRLLSFGSDGSLYVAEAGTGGTDHCMTGPEGDTVCFGLTGAVTRVHHGSQARVASGLPSLAATDGSSAIGPADVQVRGGRWALSIGAGIDATQRSTLGTEGAIMGTLLTGRTRHLAPHVHADVVAWELTHNPDGSAEHDSDPTGLTMTRGGIVLTDSGGNDLLRIDRWGHIHAIAVFPDRTVAYPPEVGGGEGPMQAVPTSVVVGPDHAYYVSQLTGFPFPAGAADIWRVVPGHAPTVWASGFTNLTDLAWHGHRLYAVQLADGGLLAATGLPMGSLVRVHRGDNSTPDTVAGNLPAPYGVALRHHSAYVTTCSVCPAGGEVVRIPLDR